MGGGQLRCLFTLNLHQSTPIIPRLKSSIIEAMPFLGPKCYAISIVKDRSDDKIYQILPRLKMHVEALGTQFFVSSSPTNPKVEDETQIKRLSELRNKAPEPLKVSAATGRTNELDGMFSQDALSGGCSQIGFPACQSGRAYDPRI